MSTLAECDGRICSGSVGGTIRVWNKATLEHERTLRLNEQDDEDDDEDDEDEDEGGDCIVRSLVVWNGRLISGDSRGKLRAWDVRTGVSERVLE